MALDSGKHTEKEINEVRCRVIETGIEKPRVDFLKDLQELPIKVEGDPQTYMLGVTDLTLNPVLAVYSHKLKTKDGRLVTPAYWNQLTEETTQEYWRYGRESEY